MEESKEAKTEMSAVKQKKEDWLVIKLEQPVKSLQGEVRLLDLTGLRSLNLDDLIEIYNLYSLNGGDGPVMQEATLLFAKLIAQRVTGLTLEALGTLSAKDAIKLKNRVYRFFYM